MITMIRSKQLHFFPAIGILAIALVLLASCGPVSPTASPTALPATATSKPAEKTPTSASTQIPPSPAVTSSPTRSPAEALGIAPSPPSTDTVLLAREDGALVLHDLSNGQERIILEPGLYSTSGDAANLIAIQWPTRLSPDGRWLLIPTPDEGTWLVSIDGQTRRRLSEERLQATWAPDSRRIAFTRERGPHSQEQDKNVYVQEVSGDKPPQLLARLPGEVFSSAWSPGCDNVASNTVGDCGRSIAVFSRVEDSMHRLDYTARLIDSVSGKARVLGHFVPPPIGGMLFPTWSSTGDRVQTIGWFDLLAFPVDGSGPRPLISMCRSPCGEPSPHGSLRAWTQLISIPDDASQLVVARTDSDTSVTFDTTFYHVEGVSWTSDGRRILLVSVTNGNLVLWAIDPANGQPQRVAAKITFFRTWDMLRQSSTQIGAKRVGLRSLPAAGDPSTWNAYALSGLGIRVRVPAEWRFEVRGSGIAETATLANFEFDQSDGNMALGNDQIEIMFERIQRPFDTDFSYWLTETARLEQDQVTVEAMTLAGHRAARVQVNIGPVSEQVRVPLGDGTELWITRRPLSSSQAAVFEQMLNSLEFMPSSSIATPEPSNISDVFPLAPGNTWIYDVALDYTDENHQLVHWTGIVTETIADARQQAGVSIYRVEIQGRPVLERSGPGPQDREEHFVVFPDRLYRLPMSFVPDSFIAGNGQGYEWGQVLAWPLEVGQRWGDPKIVAQSDGWYVWRVEARENVETTAGSFTDCHRLLFLTNPDDTTTWFCPGTGFVRHEYHHHGTRYDEVWTLREFHIRGDRPQ